MIWICMWQISNTSKRLIHVAGWIGDENIVHDYILGAVCLEKKPTTYCTLSYSLSIILHTLKYFLQVTGEIGHLYYSLRSYFPCVCAVAPNCRVLLLIPTIPDTCNIISLGW